MFDLVLINSKLITMSQNNDILCNKTWNKFGLLIVTSRYWVTVKFSAKEYCIEEKNINDNK